MQEEIVHTEEIYRGQLVQLAVHTVRLPNGRLTQRERITHPGAVGVLAIDDQQRILLVRQFRSGVQRVLYEIPAGLLEDGEAPQATAERELREETGYRPLQLEAMGGIYVAPGYTSEYIHLFLARGYEAAPLEQDSDEFVEALQVPFVEALAMVERGDIVEAKSVVALLTAARKLKL